MCRNLADATLHCEGCHGNLGGTIGVLVNRAMDVLNSGATQPRVWDYSKQLFVVAEKLVNGTDQVGGMTPYLMLDKLLWVMDQTVRKASEQTPLPQACSDVQAIRDQLSHRVRRFANPM